LAEYNPGDDWFWLAAETKRITFLKLVLLRFGVAKLRLLAWWLCWPLKLKLNLVVNEQIGVRVAIGGASGVMVRDAHRQLLKIKIKMKIVAFMGHGGSPTESNFWALGYRCFQFFSSIPIFLFLPSFCLCIKILECVFRIFFSSNLESIFQSFFSR
jgi:hypothetical protein